MKYLKEEKKNSKLPLIIVLVVCLAAAGAGIWFFSGSQTEMGDGAETATGAMTTAVQIQTPYGEVTLEGDWLSSLRYNVIQGDITELTFAAEIAGTNVKLFDLYLGREEHLAGYLTTDSGEKVPVSVVVHDIVPAEGWSEEEEEQAFAMQDMLNEILAQLGMEAAFQDLVGPEASAAAVSVQTGFGVFTYMDAWNGGLRITDESGCISGFGTLPGKQEQKLFEISIGGTGEIPAGMYTDKDGQKIPVFLTVPELTFDTEWTEQQRRDIYGMQNVLNDILEQLDLTAAEQAAETETVLEDVSITTPYGTITYPGEYTGKLRIAQDYNNGFYIRAFATMPGKTECHLFDILIGVSGDVYAGVLTDPNGNNKEVYLNVSDVNLDDSWPEEERAEVSLMQSLLNDFCEQLSVNIEAEKSESAAGAAATSDAMIWTAYGTLQYPGEYRQKLATEIAGENGNTVHFYAVRGNGARIPLFDLILGDEGDVFVGTHTAGDGTQREVYISSYELKTDDTWSNEEIQTVYAMQEASNYVLDKMEESGMLVY